MAEGEILEEEEIQEKEPQKKETQEWEDEARRMGWVPKEEFRGNPDFWKSAEEFVTHGQQELPVLRERLKAMDAKLKTQEETNKLFVDHYKKVEEKAYQRALKKLKEEQGKAVEDGDSKEFLRIEKEINELEKPSGVPIKVAEPETKKETEVSPEYIEWHKDNDWYGKDAELSQFADAMASFVQTNNPGLKGMDFFKEVERHVKEKYSDKFSNPNRDRPSAVGSGTITDEGKGGKKTYADLPEDAKKVCDDLVKAGDLKREEYVRDYFEYLEER